MAWHWKPAIYVLRPSPLGHHGFSISVTHTVTIIIKSAGKVTNSYLFSFFPPPVYAIVEQVFVRVAILLYAHIEKLSGDGEYI